LSNAQKPIQTLLLQKKMPYDEKLADRIEKLFPSDVTYTTKKMFGGLAFLVNGHMAITASGKGGILVRVDLDSFDKFSCQEHVSVSIMRGRPMKGWLRVAPEALRSKKALRQWVNLSIAYAKSLPAKK